MHVNHIHVRTCITFCGLPWSSRTGHCWNRGKKYYWYLITICFVYISACVYSALFMSLCVCVCAVFVFSSKRFECIPIFRLAKSIDFLPSYIFPPGLHSFRSVISCCSTSLLNCIHNSSKPFHPNSIRFHLSSINWKLFHCSTIVVYFANCIYFPNESKRKNIISHNWFRCSSMVLSSIQSTFNYYASEVPEHLQWESEWFY